MPRRPARPRIIHEPLVKGVVCTPVKSSNIVNLGWQEGVLQVEYNDSVYQYPSQPRSVYEVLMRQNELVLQGMPGASVGKTLIALGLKREPAVLIGHRSKETGLMKTCADPTDPALMPTDD
jgi:hypothetical protein